MDSRAGAAHTSVPASPGHFHDGRKVPVRAAYADVSTDNHIKGSVVLFFDKHTEFLRKSGTGRNLIQNPRLPDDDPNIYVDDGKDARKDCNLNNPPDDEGGG